MVWNNWIRAPKIEITFREGKKSQNATQSSVGFKYEVEVGEMAKKRGEIVVKK